MRAEFTEEEALAAVAEVPPELAPLYAQAESSYGRMTLTDQILALLASNPSRWDTKVEALNQAKVRVALANNELEWRDLPEEHWLTYIISDGLELHELLDAAATKRGAREAVAMAAKAIVEETKK